MSRLVSTIGLSAGRTSRSLTVSISTTDNPAAPRDRHAFELAAETITLRIRWFGLVFGFVLVNVLQDDNRLLLNAILGLGLGYAILDTLWSLRGRVFLRRWPLAISLLEAVFIGLLCANDQGLHSPFLFYYLLSLLVCAIRYSPTVISITFLMHAISFGLLAFSLYDESRDDVTTMVLMGVLMGWVTWASTAFAELGKSVGSRLALLNDRLQENQQLLEERIDERTRELQESQALLVQQEKHAAFGLLAAGIAHEVGNPLAAISSLVQLLNRRPTDDYTRERLEMVDDQLARIQRTLRELVDFSRPASHEAALCDIHQVTDAALSIAKYYKRKKGKRIVTRYAEGLPQVKIVRDQIVQVFLNLILNAMDATDEGGTIEISTTLNDGWLDVAVSDDGHGIDPADRDNVFQPYFTTKPTGTGLGLFVSKSLTEQNDDGQIKLLESDRLGTTFLVRLSCENIRKHPDVIWTTRVSTEEMHST